MKTLIRKLAVFLSIGFVVVLTPAKSSAIVGYYNLRIYEGDNLIANQLDTGGTNRLNSFLINGAVPDGATFTKWDSAANAFLPLSTYNAGIGRWSIDYGLTYGAGGLLRSPSLWTNTFVGDVFPPFVPYLDLNANVSNYWRPDYLNGLYLISSPIPIGTNMDQMFPYVVGRQPNDGEWVNILNPATQTYTMTTFHTGSGWDNGNPSLSVGESAWFDLGPVVVPEPAAVNLAALGAGVLLFFRRRKAA